jgi:hypothetical protein
LELEFVEDGATLPKVNAVALACIPDTFVALSGLSRDELIAKWFRHQPRLTGVYELPIGKIGLIVLPMFEFDLFKDEAGLQRSINLALEMAGRMGAKTVSLTGMIPSATADGSRVADWTKGRKKLPVVTTGDATRTATIIKTIEGTLERTGRKFANEAVAFVGLKSIGRASVFLALEVLPHPRHILLADPYLKEAELTAVRDEILRRGFKGKISLHPNGGGIPAPVYEASFIVGTTSIPGILDTARLAPGTILVDYSFPSSFRLHEAVRRYEADGDIVFTTGGELHYGKAPIKETLYLPAAVQESADAFDGRALSLLAGRDAHEITGCIVASLLTGMTKDVKPTIGPVCPEDVLAHYQFLAQQGFKPAPLQMHRYRFSDTQLAEFGSREWEKGTYVG